VNPARCPVDYTIVSATEVGGASISAGSFGTYDSVNNKFVLPASSARYTDTTNGYKPGTYTVTVQGSVRDAVSSTTDTATLQITLVDVCDPPTSITPSSPSDVSYTISDNPATKVVPAFSVEPSYCTLSYLTPTI